METVNGTVNGSLTVSLVAVMPGLVPTVGFMLFPTCPGMLWTITWSWLSYGGARSSGVRFGRGQPKTVWITWVSGTTLIRPWEVLPSIDGDTQGMEHGVASGLFRHRHGRHALPSARRLVSYLQRPSPSCFPAGYGYA